MADVGGIILKAAQGLVAQRQNQQRLAMQAAQMAHQIQQAERTLKLQREELDMRKQMMEHKEEALELEAKRAETGERAVGVQERQIGLAERRLELMGKTEQLLKQTEIDYTKAKISQIQAEIASGSSPESIHRNMIAKNQAYILSLNKNISAAAKQGAMAQFMAEGRVVIGDQLIERPPNMPLLDEESVERTIVDSSRQLRAAQENLKMAERAASRYAGKNTPTARQMLAARDAAQAEVQRWKTEVDTFNQYSLMYKQLGAAALDQDWREVAIAKMSGGNPAMQQVLELHGMTPPSGINTPGGKTLFTPAHRLSYIGGARGTKPGKFEKYTSDEGVSYGERLQFSWRAMKGAEPDTKSWETGMGVLKSLTVDNFGSDEEVAAFANALREEWAVDITNPNEMNKFQAVMRSLLKARGYQFK